MGKQSPVEQAVVYIKSHWQRGENLTEIALKFAVDPGNLTRAFRMREGKTAKQFIDAKRKEHLLLLISAKRQFGYELGSELGFSNDFSFYRWVRRAFGMSFKKLRHQHAEVISVKSKK